MIQFHRVNVKPTKIPAGEEAIWFADYGAIYVADKEGNPVLIAAGSKSGSAIPTGVPSEPNILYYCTANKTHYVAGDKWYEIPRRDTGSVGGPTTTAGNVIINDLQDWYTSVDVEGALTEIGEVFPHFFGTKKLKNYDGDMLTVNESFERYATSLATNKPGTVGWLNTRLANDNVTYGTLVDSTGDMYTYVNNKYTKLASDTSFTDFSKEMDKKMQDFLNENDISKKTLEVGPGIISNNKGYGDGLKIELDMDAIANVDHSHKEYLKKTGDTATGIINIASETRDSAIVLMERNGQAVSNLYFNQETKNTGLYDIVNNHGIVWHNIKNGNTNIQAGSVGTDRNLYLNSNYGNVYIHSSGHISTRSKGSTTAIDLGSAKGTLRIGTSDTKTYIESFVGTNANSSRDIMLSGGLGRMINKMTSQAIFTYGAEAVVAGSSMHVGMNPDTQYGSTEANKRINSLLCLYPFLVNSESGANRNYARLGYNQQRGVLQVQSFKKNTAKVGYTDRTNTITIEANRFINTSSEVFKENIKEFEFPVLDDVLNVKPYFYNFKDDHNKEEHAGFIIERGVPKIAIESDGKAIDQYAMLSYLWKGFQEYVSKTDEKIAQLEKRLENA